MDNSFDLSVFYNNKEMILPAQLRQYGYTYKIEVEVNGMTLFFERDDERNWRAIAEPSDAEKNPSINLDMLRAIADSLEQAFQ